MEIKAMLDKLTDKLTSWAETVMVMLPNLAIAILIVVVFWLLSKLAHKLTLKALTRLHTNRAARGLLATFVRLLILAAGLVIALGVMNLDKALASILAGAGIVGLALGFAFQDMAANLISGVGLAVNREWPFKIGDVVETNGVFGTVKNIQLRTSVIETPGGKTVILPNRQIYQEKVVNYSMGRKHRVEVECGVSYGDDLEKVRKVVTDTLSKITERDSTRDIEVFFKAFGDSSINFVARFWIEFSRPVDELAAMNQAILGIKKAFDEADIMIPFPIRTVDFGIRGGEKLEDVLRKTSGA